MSPGIELWLLIAAMGVVTYAIRLSLIGALGRWTVPAFVVRALRYVAPAVLSAIALPEMVRPAGHIDLSLGNARLLAGLLAALVAYRTRSVLATIVVGMVALWGLQALIA
jgi:branched-subunit amino acid transport protein